MGIPKNITKEHLLEAISKIDNDGIPKDGESQYFDVIYNGKKYPPKLIVSYANIFANGSALNRNIFEGGIGTPCFKLLEENNFVIQKKTVSYYLLGAAWYGNDDSPDQTKRFIENGIWENGYADKLLGIVNGVNVGDRVAIKSSFATREGKSVLRVKATGTVSENLGDGRNLKIKWDKNFIPFDLEGYGGYRNTIQKVSEEDIDVIFNSHTEMSYYPELKKFLAQSKTTELGISEYLKKFQGLSVKVGFGKGIQARIPWIAFLNEIDRVQKGIYPVYLYYKEQNLLILAFGVSETNPSNRNWNITNEKTIKQYFLENNLGNPARYGSSFFFKSYDINKGVIEQDINNDLNKLISIYKGTTENSKTPTIQMEEFNHKSFYDAALGAGYFINKKLSTRFISSLLAKPFVILTGLSGSGKTKLAQAFAKWICESKEFYCIVPVGADWTSREPLLGFPNALEKHSYVFPENGVLKLIIEASRKGNEKKPFFLILDEMNLSHVERYFADFLSVMESKESILLHAGEGDWNGVPHEIKFPQNLFLIGTVNIDETTYMFSPKVLDRANVIEFRVTKEEMKNYMTNKRSVLKLDDLDGMGKDMAENFVAIAKDENLQVDDSDKINSELLEFFIELKKNGAEFGYRSASEILRFAAVINNLEPGWNTADILDAVVMQKLLPKVHGSRKRLAPILETLGNLCMTEKLKEGEKMEQFLNPQDEEDFSSRIKYPLSFEKISRMYRALLHNGFTSYAEA